MVNKNGGSGTVVLIIFGIILLIIFLFSVGSYNSLVRVDANVQQKLGNVQTALQRQADLIPNLVETVKAYSKYEGNTQTQIAALRSGISNAKNSDDLNKVGKDMNSLISNLIVSVEAYPELKANQNFLALQDELAGSQNRITWERNNYNEAVRQYKTSIRSFPTNILAGMFGFDVDKWNMFSAEPGAETAPKVKF